MDKKERYIKITEEESELFRSSVKHIKKIKSDKVRLIKKSPKIRKEIIQEENSHPQYYLSDYIENHVLPEERLFFARQGVSAKQIKQLKHGKLPINKTLDLHGYSVNAAKEELRLFIESAYQEQRRCLHIIHGKGQSDQPILKNKINHWLKQIHHVLAFCTALPKHGGTGAIYLLLKNKD